MGTDETSSALFEGATTIVALTFDDTYADNYQVGAMADARGIPVTFYVNSTRIGQSGSMTQTQLEDLEARGHEIGGHTLSHANLPTLSEADARVQVCNDRVNLLNAGFDVTSFAYPFGADNATVQRIVADCNYNSGRDVGGLVAGSSCNGCPYANTIPPQNVLALRTQSSVESTTTLAQMQEYVLQAERNGGGFVPIVFHHVCDGCNSQAVTPATLSAFMDWLEDRAPATQVGTVHEVIGGAVKPGVTAPPPTTEPPPASNLLRNPSLETDADRNAIPDCWQRGSTGTNTSSYSLVNDAYDGSVAQRITITSFTSGARRLVSLQDQGTCAPPVTPGHAYTVSAYYKGNVQPLFSVWYRNASGGWVWFAQSGRFPASTTYRQATYTTPPMPSGATAISVGLSLVQTGTLTVDAHQLVDATPTTDTTAPTLSITCNGGACASAAYSAPVNVALTAADSSGIREVRYTTNGSDPTTGTLYTAPFTVSSTATVRAIAIDNAGNQTTLSQTIMITAPPTDTTAPTLAITCNGSTCSSTAYASAVTVGLSASDASGIREVRYTTDGSDPATGTLYTAPFTVSSTATVRAIAIDNANNQTTLSQTITITPPPTDTTPPTLSITCNGGTCASTFTSAVTVALFASDTSGIRELRYTTNGSDPATGTLYTAPFTVSSTATVRAFAIDNANNQATLSQTITIDTAPPSNLLQNGSLETDADGNAIPDCWKRDGYGTNTATYTLVNDAFDGNIAQRIDITSWSSGGRRLASAQDAGACAPAVLPGRRYTVTGYYKASTPVRVSVYVRGTNGSWRWFAESALLPTSTTYRQATYTTAALPSDVTHISVGLSIFNVGFITSDAMTLVEAP